MSTIDDMLRATAEETLPPAVRWLKARLAAGDELKVELDRTESEFGSSTIELAIHRKEGGVDQSPQPLVWDDELNAALVNLGIRAVDLEGEAERFALALRAALRKVARRYGDGYLNTVLVDLIDESNISKDGEIAEIRKYVQTPSTERNRTYTECRDQIASEVGARAAELREKLEYKEDQLKAIMSKAIARYLDERFSVTRRRALGLL